MTNPKSKKRFSLVLIKPSHYDDDGYVIQWFRSAIPANSLACLYGLALECAKQKILGETVAFEIHAFDETNTNIKLKKIISLIENADDGIVMLVGVQSNQFPRALDLAQTLREKNIKVAIGGFHVSGTMAVLKERDPHVQNALDLGVTFFAGEAEGRLGQVLIDAFENKLPEIYNFMDDLPNIENVAGKLGRNLSKSVENLLHWRAHRNNFKTRNRHGNESGQDDVFITWLNGCIDIEKIHPLEGGFLRRKHRTSRRSGLKLENPLIFYPKVLLETLRKQIQWITLYSRLRLIYRKVRKDPKKFEYMDLALEPVMENEIETRELFQSEAAHNYLNKVHRNEKIRHGETV